MNTTSSIFFPLYRKPRLYHTPAILLLLALITSPCALGGSGSGKHRPRSDTPIATKKYEPRYMAGLTALFDDDANQSDLTKKIAQKIARTVRIKVQQLYVQAIEDELKKQGYIFNAETRQIEEIGQKIEKRNKGNKGNKEIDKQKNKPNPIFSPSAPWFNKDKKTKPCSPSTQQGAAPIVGLDSGNCLCFFAAGTVALCATLGKEGIDQLTQQLPEKTPPFLAPRKSTIRNSLINSLNQLKEAFFCHDENKTGNDRQQQADNAANNIREQLMEYQQNHTQIKEDNALFSKADQRQQDPAEYLNLLLDLTGGRGSSFQFNETDTTDSYVPDFLETFLTDPQNTAKTILEFTEHKTTTKKMLIINVEPGDSLQKSIDAYLDTSLDDTKEAFDPFVLKKQLRDNKNILIQPNDGINSVRDIFTTDNSERLNALNTLNGLYNISTHNTRKLSARLTSNKRNPPTQFKTLIIQHSLSIENTGDNGQYGARKMDEKELQNNNSVSDNTLMITFDDTKTNKNYLVTFTRTAICAHTGSGLNSGHYVALIKDTSVPMHSFIKYDGHTISKSKTLASHMKEGIGDICISFYTVEKIHTFPHTFP